ncbi:hypothetical protein VKT23_000342 [Stygiomarasmius scandens]|uniref:Uncharacterized protein n=1 Tax=Marasmiellus scandens TaxID=2682957 RepID=A0ABR1K770_9AGAR
MPTTLTEPPSYPLTEITPTSPRPPSCNSDTSFETQSTARDAEILISAYLPDASPSSPTQHDQKQTSPIAETLSPPPQIDFPLPLCIPQTSVGASFDSAFARAYSDALQDVGISEKMWLDFVDGLNLAIVSSPPVRVVDLFGQAIGFLPWDWAILSSVAIVTATQTGMRVVSKRVADRYLRAANLRLFQPRGLSARLCTTRAMLALIGGQSAGQEEPPQKSKAKATLHKVGRRVGTLFLLTGLPITSRVVRAIADRPPVVEPIPGESTEHVVLRRRLALVSGLALPLRFEGLSPPTKPQGIRNVMNGWSVKLDKRIESRREKRNEQSRRMLQKIDEELARGKAIQDIDPFLLRTDQSSVRLSSSYAHSEDLPATSSISGNSVSGTLDNADDAKSIKKKDKEAKREEREIRKELKARHKAERQEAELEKKNERRARKGLPPKTPRGSFAGHGSFIGTPMQRRVANADLVEHWANEDILWLVLMKSEGDRVIQDIELAESPENEEHVNREEWAPGFENF